MSNANTPAQAKPNKYLGQANNKLPFHTGDLVYCLRGSDKGRLVKGQHYHVALCTQSISLAKGDVCLISKEGTPMFLCPEEADLAHLDFHSASGEPKYVVFLQTENGRRSVPWDADRFLLLNSTGRWLSGSGQAQAPTHHPAAPAPPVTLTSVKPADCAHINPCAEVPFGTIKPIIPSDHVTREEMKQLESALGGKLHAVSQRLTDNFGGLSASVSVCRGHADAARAAVDSLKQSIVTALAKAVADVPPVDQKAAPAAFKIVSALVAAVTSALS